MNRLPRTLLFGLIVALAPLAVTGCATMGGTMEENWPEHPWEMPYPPQSGPREGQILHVRTGRLLTEEELARFVTEFRVVYVSEAHDNPAAHRIQATVLEALAERYPGKIALGMEMFPFTAQDDLDRFNRGEMSQRNFRRLWAKHWNVDQDYYEPLLKIVRERKVPIIGLNLPSDMTHTLTRQGADGIDEADREHLPEMGPSDPYQRTFLESIFAGHTMGSGQLDRFVTVQNTWEESMAQQAARYLTEPGGEDRRLLVVAGGHHVDYGFGIPRRLFRRVPTSYVSIMPRIADPSSVPEEKLMDVETPELPLLPADIYWFVRYEELPAKQKLGVGIAPVDNGIRVLSVLPGSPAERAGILAEDVLVEMDGLVLKEPFDLVDTVRQKHPGDRVRITLVRNGERLEVEAEFTPPQK